MVCVASTAAVNGRRSAAASTRHGEAVGGVRRDAWWRRRRRRPESRSGCSLACSTQRSGEDRGRLGGRRLRLLRGRAHRDVGGRQRPAPPSAVGPPAVQASATRVDRLRHLQAPADHRHHASSPAVPSIRTSPSTGATSVVGGDRGDERLQRGLDRPARRAARRCSVKNEVSRTNGFADRVPAACDGAGHVRGQSGDGRVERRRGSPCTSTVIGAGRRPGTTCWSARRAPARASSRRPRRRRSWCSARSRRWSSPGRPGRPPPARATAPAADSAITPGRPPAVEDTAAMPAVARPGSAPVAGVGGTGRPDRRTARPRSDGRASIRSSACAGWSITWVARRRSTPADASANSRASAIPHTSPVRQRRHTARDRDRAVRTVTCLMAPARIGQDHHPGPRTITADARGDDQAAPIGRGAGQHHRRGGRRRTRGARRAEVQASGPFSRPRTTAGRDRESAGTPAH